MGKLDFVLMCIPTLVLPRIPIYWIPASNVMVSTWLERLPRHKGSYARLGCECCSKHGAVGRACVVALPGSSCAGL